MMISLLKTVFSLKRKTIDQNRQLEITVWVGPSGEEPTQETKRQITNYDYEHRL